MVISDVKTQLERITTPRKREIKKAKAQLLSILDDDSEEGDSEVSGSHYENYEIMNACVMACNEFFFIAIV